MKQKLLLTAFLCFMLFNATLAQVSNGDFEQWSGSSPSGWTTIDNGISVAKTTSVVKSGSASAKITVNTTTQSSTDFLQTISVTPGTSYTFSVWVYITDGYVRPRLYVDGYRDYGNTALKNTWQKISYTYTPTSSSIVVGLRFYDVSGFDGSEVVYVDAFEPSTSGGGGGGGSSCSGTALTLNLTTDNYGSETSWELTTSTGTVLYSGSGYGSNADYTENFCLASGSYKFNIYDSYGDGICCSHGNGSYTLFSSSSTYASGGSFGSSATTSFSIGSGGGDDGGGDDDYSGYYADASGLTGYSLKTALYNIIKGHTTRRYSALWSFYSANELDYFYENDGSILDMYSENPNGNDSYNFSKVSDQCGSYSGEGSCYNREHSFPRSWFGGEVEPMNSDIHHIFPTDGYVNAKRSSYPYGEVGSASYVSDNGSKVGNAASGLGYSGTVFEPIDEFKGDFARAYFYMATRYENVIGGWQNNTSYGNAILDGSSNRVFETWFISMLMDWHNADPVSSKEISRNNAAYSYQGNRNPFVDHPEFASKIWGSYAFSRLSKETDVIEAAQLLVVYNQGTIRIKEGTDLVKGIVVFDLTGKVLAERHFAEAASRPEVNLILSSNKLYVVKVETEKGIVSQLVMVK